MDQEIKNEKTRKILGKRYKLSESQEIHLIGGDYFLIGPIGRIELILGFTLYRGKSGRSLEVTKSILVDDGIEKQGVFT